MKVAFVSFATGAYIDIQKKLITSIQQFGYDIMVFNDFAKINSPTHEEHPYAFKLYSILAAYRLGYDVVIWCDSPQRLVRKIDEWLLQIRKVGVYLQADSWQTGQWANDASLAYFNHSRDQAMQVQTVYACIMAFDFRHPITLRFLSEWLACMKAGLFRGQWKNDAKTESQDDRCLGHRHDQTNAEFIANKLSIPLQVPVTSNPAYTGPSLPPCDDATWFTGRFFTTWDNA